MPTGQLPAEPRPSGSDRETSSRTVTQGRREIILAALAGCLLLTAQAAKADKKAWLADGQQVNAAAIRAYDSQESLHSAAMQVDDDLREVKSLVLWGEPRKLARRPGVSLADGSWLLSDRTWSPTGLLRIDTERVKLRRGSGWVDFPRETVEWIILDAEAAGFSLDSLDKEDRDGSEQDLVVLTNGDRVTGRVVELTGDKLTIDVGGNPVETTLEEVAALRLSNPPLDDRDIACLVGLSDGSLLHASQVRVADDQYTLESAGVTIAGKADAIALIQPMGGTVRYLSDLEPVDYRHTPYLDLTWPYTQDRGLRGGPLVGGGLRAAKGLAMHSAARLIYRLDGSAQRFQAELAVADSSDQSTAIGSVVFRVYLVKAGQFESAYESGIIRTGDPAIPIDLDTTGAAALALVIDYADNGDAGDDALWLNARLVESP